MLLCVQPNASGTDGFNLGRKIHFNLSADTLEPYQTKFLTDKKDKAVTDVANLVVGDCGATLVCDFSDFLTTTRTRIYKSQNDP